jgi:hypothetical protein
MVSAMHIGGHSTLRGSGVAFSFCGGDHMQMSSIPGGDKESPM